MTESLIQHEIDRLLDAIDGDVTTHSRVVNGLLDLRLAGAEYDLLVRAVDDALITIPGRTAVPNPWWLARLEEFRTTLGKSAECSPATA